MVMKKRTILLILTVFLVASCGEKSDEVEDGDADAPGLTWQNPPAESPMVWQDAMDYCENLTLDGHGDWRLPTISELRSLLRGCPATQTGGSCGVDDGCLSSSCWNGCLGCSIDGGPDDGCYRPVEAEGPCDWYWSSSSREDADSFAWTVSYDYGDVSNDRKANGNYVRCVR